VLRLDLKTQADAVAHAGESLRGTAAGGSAWPGATAFAARTALAGGTIRAEYRAGHAGRHDVVAVDAPEVAVAEADLAAAVQPIYVQALGERGKALLNVIDQASYALFGVVSIIMKVAPIGAFGAILLMR